MLRRSFHISTNCCQNLLAWSNGHFESPTFKINKELKRRPTRYTLYISEDDRKNHEQWKEFTRLISSGKLDDAKFALEAWSDSLSEEMILAGFETLVSSKKPAEKVKDIGWLLNFRGVNRYPVRLAATFLHEACEERLNAKDQTSTVSDSSRDILDILNEIKQQRISSKDVLKHSDILTQSDIELVKMVGPKSGF